MRPDVKRDEGFSVFAAESEAFKPVPDQDIPRQVELPFDDT